MEDLHDMNGVNLMQLVLGEMEVAHVVVLPAGLERPGCLSGDRAVLVPSSFADHRRVTDVILL